MVRTVAIHGICPPRKAGVQLVYRDELWRWDLGGRYRPRAGPSDDPVMCRAWYVPSGVAEDLWKL